MPTRRKFLESAAAVSAAPFAAEGVLAEGTRAAAQMGVLYDHRHESARAFRRRATHLHAPIHGTPNGDVTELWQHYFSAAWREQPMPLAGLTERPALFMLEQLGRDYGLRVVFQAEHEAVEDGDWVHRVTRSTESRLQGELEAAGAGWPGILADELLTAPHRVVSADVSPSGAAMAAHLNEPTKLYSWIIAPKSAVASI